MALNKIDLSQMCCTNISKQTFQHISVLIIPFIVLGLLFIESMYTIMGYQVGSFKAVAYYSIEAKVIFHIHPSPWQTGRKCPFSSCRSKEKGTHILFHIIFQATFAELCQHCPKNCDVEKGEEIKKMRFVLEFRFEQKNLQLSSWPPTST